MILPNVVNAQIKNYYSAHDERVKLTWELRKIGDSLDVHIFIVNDTKQYLYFTDLEPHARWLRKNSGLEINIGSDPYSFLNRLDICEEVEPMEKKHVMVRVFNCFKTAVPGHIRTQYIMGSTIRHKVDAQNLGTKGDFDVKFYLEPSQMPDKKPLN